MSTNRQRWHGYLRGAVTALVLSLLVGCRLPTRYVIPEGYEGWVVVGYEFPGCKPMPRDGLWRVVELDGNGRFCTSSDFPTGWSRLREFCWEMNEEFCTNLHDGAEGPEYPQIFNQVVHGTTVALGQPELNREQPFETFFVGTEPPIPGEEFPYRESMKWFDEASREFDRYK